MEQKPIAPKTTRLFKRYAAILWSIAGFFAIGYVPTAVFKTPVVAMVAAALAIIPFGSRAASPFRGALRGLGLGAVAGLSLYNTMLQIPAVRQAATIPASMPLPRAPITAHIFLYVGATAALCAAVSTLYALQAVQRRKRIEEQWRPDGRPKAEA